jgi:hypothetical protein
MNIRKCKSEDWKILIEFNEKVYSNRKAGVETLFNFRYKNRMSDFCENVILTDEKEIFGQNLVCSASCYVNDLKYNGFWSMNTIVRDDMQGGGYGKKILQKVMDTDIPYWGTGVSDVALKMYLKQKFYKYMGELKKYICLMNPFSVLLSPLLKLSLIKYSQHTNNFSLLEKEQVIGYNRSFNSDIAEFCRDTDFLHWRFFEAPCKYAFYKNNFDDSYFVVRVIKKKGILILSVVDYRCSFSNKFSFEEIIKATKKLALKIHCPFVLFSSTLKITDNVLENMRFKRIGRDRPMVSTLVTEEDATKINKREYVLVNFADSDGDPF